MKINLLVLTLTIATILCFITCEDATTAIASEQSQSEAAIIEHGEYLTRIMGCDHCHSPKKMTPKGPVPDMDRWMMGFPNGDPLPEIDLSEVTPGKWALFNGDLTAAVGPWGITYGANLTPHETGIGNWTFEQFKRALTQGKHKGLENGRPILPPMPWQTYREVKEEDLKAIFAYLKSIKPIENIVPAHVPFEEIQ